MVRRNFHLTIAVTLAACGGKTPPPADGSQAELVGLAVSAYCDGIKSCCETNGYAFNAPACDSNLRSEFSAQAACSGASVFDADAAAECFAGIGSALARCATEPPAIAACEKVCTGTVPTGSACTSFIDCAPSADGHVACTGTSHAPGVCIVEQHGKLGDACNLTCTQVPIGAGQNCDNIAGIAYDPNRNIPSSGMCYVTDGLYCSDADARCHAQQDIGASCTGSYQCQSSAYCDASQTCAAKRASGASCTSNECLGWCDTATGVCRDSTTPMFTPSAETCADPEYD